MAAFSQNGYPANDRSFITTYEVTKTGRRLALRSGPAGQLLAHWVRWFDENIRDIDPGILDDWGYAERAIRGGVELSNHASGTAADVDATRWPLGVQPEAYLTAAEIAKVRARLKAYEGCIRWGGDYTGRKDPMHFEIDRPEADCARVLKKLLAQPTAADIPAPAPLPLPVGDDMHFAQTPDGTVWKITDYDVSPEPGIYRYGALSKARDGKLVKLTLEELRDNKGDADERRARLLTDIAKAAGGDVDEAQIVAGLIPAITEALAGRTGATREEIAELLRGITLRAA